ncbi:MAG: ubiquinol-cytochrome C chaperone family protein [Alphaproteobacteria bacterium]|nr:ubiquinol-cytochrome C chaperone family protein [Alphaproteobacteria bacterium]
MFKSISNWISPKHRQASAWARAAYVNLVKEARNPRFYTDSHVPDTEDGRFDMVLLHVAIETWGLLQRNPPEKLKAQALFDALFLDMDMALRQIGVGDLGIPHHMRRMFKLYKGRCYAYAEALTQNNRALLTEVITRNIYRKVENVPENIVAQVADYVEARAREAASLREAA